MAPGRRRLSPPAVLTMLSGTRQSQGETATDNHGVRFWAEHLPAHRVDERHGRSIQKISHFTLRHRDAWYWFHGPERTGTSDDCV